MAGSAGGVQSRRGRAAARPHRELRHHGRATGIEHRTGSSPLTSLPAVLVGWIVVVPPFVSVFRMHGRVKAAQTYLNTVREAERGRAAAVAAATT